MPLLSIIILSYNTKELILKCVRSLVYQYKRQLGQGEFEIIVVDNASTDDSIKEIKKSFDFAQDKIFIIENSENFGFSKGNNVGAKHARGKYLLFLNSDTEVQDRGLLGMVDFLDGHDEIGILGGRLQSENGSTQRSVGHFLNLFSTFLVLFGGERIGVVRFRPRLKKKVDWVSGASLMIRSKLFEKLGGFDENIFMYLEDVELCFRAKKMGYQTWFYPDISILHKEHGSSDRTFAILHIYKGLLYFYKKHKTPLEYSVLRILLMLKTTIALGIGVITKNKYLTNTYTKALASI